MTQDEGSIEVFRKAIHIMGDPSSPHEKRVAARRSLIESDTTILLLALIEAREDPRIFVNAAIPVQGDGTKDHTGEPMTVGCACQQILQSKISPVGGTLYMLSVKNWSRWWQQHSDMTLDEIQAEVRKFEGR